MSDTSIPTGEPDAAAPAVPVADGSSIGRRTALAGAGLAALGAVAACGAGGSGSVGAATSSKQPKGAPGTVLGTVSEVPVGGGTVFAAEQVVVTQPAPGRFQGLSAVCTHQGCQVNAVQDGQVICPCHGSRFGLDGAVIEGPAQSPLPRRAVAVQGQNITLA